MSRLLRSGRLIIAVATADIIVFIAFWLSLYFFRDWLSVSGLHSVPINPIEPYLFSLIVYLPFWLGLMIYNRLYKLHRPLTSIHILTSTLKVFAVGLCGSLAIAYLFKQWDIGRFVLLLTPFLYALWIYFSRSGMKRSAETAFRRGVGVTRVIVVGVGPTARRAARRLTLHHSGAFRLLGFIDSHHKIRISGPLDGIPVLGAIGDIHDVLKTVAPDEVYLAVPRMPQGEILNLVSECEHSDAEFKVVSNLFTVIGNQIRIDEIDELPVFRLRNAKRGPVDQFLKRALDVSASISALVLFGAPMLLVAVLIKLDSKGPALFAHRRIGLGGKPFSMLKFRTMYSETDPYADAPTQADDPRITRLGRILRKYSIDEFPQLLNVLLGDMAMVGPRPEMPYLVENYSNWERRRLDVKPGVTGLWQIAGRKNLPLHRNMEYDFYYINNQSLLFDIVILIKTVPAVIFGKGAF